MKNFFNFNTQNIFIFFFGILTFFGSIYQGLHIYDGFHWGLVGSNAQDFLNGKKPYEDFFIHYGFLTVLFQSLALKIYNSIFSLLILSALVYSTSLILLANLAKKFLSEKYIYLLILIIFFMQPFVVYPWHTYFILLISILSILFFIKKKNYSLFLFGFCLQIGFLFSESYKIFSILILITSILIVYLEKSIFEKKLRKIMLIILGYLIPLILFLIYLFYNNLFDSWILHSKIPSIFLDELNTNLTNLLLNFVIRYFHGSLNVFSASYFLLGLIINFACIIFLIFYLIKKEKNLDLFFIAYFALLLNFMLVFRHESFRFFCGPIIGIIILFYFISNLKNDLYKQLSIILVIFIALISNPFEKGNSNKNFINKSQKILSYNDTKIQKMRGMSLTNDTWQHLIKLNLYLENIKIACPNIKYFYNATPDHYYYFLASDFLKLIQKIPGNSESLLKNYYDSLNNVFDTDLEKKLTSNIDKGKIVFVRENYKNNYLKIKKIQINLNDYYFKELPFSYNNKKKLLYIPNNCTLK